MGFFLSMKRKRFLHDAGGNPAIAEIVQFFGRHSHEIVIVIAGHGRGMDMLLQSHAELDHCMAWRVDFPHPSLSGNSLNHRVH